MFNVLQRYLFKCFVWKEDTTYEMYEARRRKIAELLLKHGCPIDTVKKSGDTVLNLTLQKVDVILSQSNHCGAEKNFE